MPDYLNHNRGEYHNTKIADDLQKYGSRHQQVGEFTGFGIEEFFFTGILRLF